VDHLRRGRLHRLADRLRPAAAALGQEVFGNGIVRDVADRLGKAVPLVREQDVGAARAPQIPANGLELLDSSNRTMIHPNRTLQHARSRRELLNLKVVRKRGWQLEEQGKALQLVNWITDRAINGVPTLVGSEALAIEYLQDPNYADNDARVASLINWESAKNFSSGFAAGLGGFTTAAVTIPASMTATWVLQARMAGTIARIYGHDLAEDRVRSFVILSLLGDKVKDSLKQVGIQVTTKVSANLVRQIPNHMILQLNRAVGFRLLTKAGTTGAVNLTKLIPVIGGLVGGSFDLFTCRTVGGLAQDLFRPLASEPQTELQPAPG
jgi:hypothetical protein